MGLVNDLWDFTVDVTFGVAADTQKPRFQIEQARRSSDAVLLLHHMQIAIGVTPMIVPMALPCKIVGTVSMRF